MVGNNSCGSYSIVYGTTRDHVLEISAILSDGSPVVFGAITPPEFAIKCELDTLEGDIYRQIRKELSDPIRQQTIRDEFPAPDIHRRNTGYAVDVLLESEVFTEGGESFNLCKFITGSEGTLALITEVKINCDSLPPKEVGLLCAHFTSVSESLKAVLIAMEHSPRAVELMDKIVMDCTLGQRMYEANRFFIQGDPEAVLVIEVGGDSKKEVEQQINTIEEAFKNADYGYAFPRVLGSQVKKVWDLRKAGLGLLANVPGDAKPVAVIEDTAVSVSELPAYIEEFSAMMEQYGQRTVYYAHAGAGELHLRPILDLKKKKDVVLFRKIGHSTAELVKKFRGSLSGEHGDGRVRAEFLPLMVGEDNYELLRRIKGKWDPQNLFNPGKIVDAPPMDVSLRYELDQSTRQFETVLDFSATDGILRAAEKCNGSGDCRKSHLSGGTMCPSFMATRNEKDTTRARSNILREILTRSEAENPFESKEIYEVMDLCLSCKGCASECPSNVNVATLKAEFLHQHYSVHGVPFRARAIANVGKLNQLGMLWPALTNFFLTGAGVSSLTKKIMGVAPARNLPPIHKQSLRSWFHKNKHSLSAQKSARKVYFFCDEFTNFQDTPIGITAIKLLDKLGYQVELIHHAESGRAYLSKGLLKTARNMARENVAIFKDLISAKIPLLGVEPSAILGFRDEYPLLVSSEEKEAAQKLGENALLVDEFLAREIREGRLSSASFTHVSKDVLLHGHCHQKALSDLSDTISLLNLPENYSVEVIPSGCCGMAGSFGYEKEHYKLSMQVGELVLFPTVRKSAADTILAAPGTSCRHQIADGTGRKALHPVEILWEALK
ncbi:UNVERIFIED_CONTAM: hypothetical protein GTU68_037188 [Idotea baltica]|nr:hypothetical protein [Idotea baltica]